jgi:hypothetical protein
MPAVLLAVLPAGPAMAQINIERLRLEDDRQGLIGSASVALNFQTGNTEKRRGDGKVRLDLLRPASHSFLILSGDLDWTSGSQVSNKGLAHVRHIHRPAARVSPEAFGQINYDKARSLDLRALVGAGARVVLTERDRGRASFGLAYMFEREELELPPGSAHPQETSHHRVSSFLAVSFEPRPGLALASTSYVQPRLDAFSDVRVLSQSQLAVQLLGPLSLDLTLNLAYDADPPDETESLDVALRTGIGIRF